MPSVRMLWSPSTRGGSLLPEVCSQIDNCFRAKMHIDVPLPLFSIGSFIFLGDNYLMKEVLDNLNHRDKSSQCCV